MGKTNIDWTDISINPFVGCSKCSPACENCFAERFAYRLSKNPKTAAKYAGVVDDKGHWTGQISKLDLSCFDKLPKKPSHVFVGSMTDLFYDIDDYKHVNKVMDVFVQMEVRPWHTFMLLTKRPENAKKFYVLKGTHYWGNVDGIKGHGFFPYHWPQNIWLGVTVCNQEEADKKIPILLQIPAAKRFISVEPMLSAVDIRQYLQGDNKLDWVIAGGETGPNARPTYLSWVRSLRDQCLITKTPYFFKSWGDWVPNHQMPDNVNLNRHSVKAIIDNNNYCSIFMLGKKYSGHLIDGVEYRQFPEV